MASAKAAVEHTFTSNVLDTAFCDAYARTLPGSGARYIPWALLYAEARQRHPSLQLSQPEVISAGTGAIVRITCTVPAQGYDAETWLAVTDNRGRAMSEPDAAAIANTVSRCTAKVISMCTGLGLSMWFGDAEFLDTAALHERASEAKAQRTDVEHTMQTAESLDVLDAAAKLLRGMTIPQAERDRLVAIYTERRAALSGGA